MHAVRPTQTDGRTNIMAIARLFVLRNALRASNSTQLMKTTLFLPPQARTGIVDTEILYGIAKCSITKIHSLLQGVVWDIQMLCNVLEHQVPCLISCQEYDKVACFSFSLLVRSRQLTSS